MAGHQHVPIWTFQRINPTGRARRKFFHGHKIVFENNVRLYTFGERGVRRRAGLPAPVVPARPSRVTALPAPIIASSPMVIPQSNTAPEPMDAPRLTKV